jgi:hypothetical protein
MEIYRFYPATADDDRARMKLRFSAHTDHFVTEPAELGAVLGAIYLLAGALGLLAIRRAWPRISNWQMVLVAICVTALLVAATVGALDAGDG